MEQVTVTPVYLPNEVEIAKFRMMDIRFDCLVRMYDNGQVERKSLMPFVQSKPLPPQWFKSEMKLTMEFIEDADPYQLGVAIKKQWQKMKDVILDYEQSGKIQNQ